MPGTVVVEVGNALPSLNYSRLPPPGLVCELSTYTPGRPVVNHSSCHQVGCRLQLSPFVRVVVKAQCLICDNADLSMGAFVGGVVLGWRRRLALILELKVLFKTRT